MFDATAIIGNSDIIALDASEQRRKLDSGCATYSHRLMHEPEEERAPAVVKAPTYANSAVVRLACGCASA